VTAIVLPRYQANLPPGPGREAFAVNCLSCHSTRYITMQPKMTAVKWEESVRKMMKTYAAPIAEDQVQPIVQYLMAAKEGGDGSSWETPAAIVTTPSVTAASTDWPGNATHGQALYTQNCASCHGADGKSNTPAAATQLPRPTDLTSGRFTAAAIAASITHGVPGTAMPAAAIHSGDDVNDVVAYVQQFEPHESAATLPSGDDVKDLFAKNCASCHGATGMGDGVAAPPLARTPANFHARQPTVTHAISVVADGVPGTAMPAWKTKLSESQRAKLAGYVHAFYEGR
jgi:mono/diheme cytochrome c family protein